MADINSSDVKLKQSQRLDDTDYGGGQMIATEVIDGVVNNLFPDISRLDRVYGRVSMRKAFLNIETENRATYYGSNIVITEQAADPKVSVLFFTTKNWFDTRDSAKSRVESYLVKGPTFPGQYWADHYLGSRQINIVTELDQTPPEIGEVIVLTAKKNLAGQSISELEQYVRITDVATEVRLFTESDGDLFEKQAMYIGIGSRLLFDIPGGDPNRTSNYSSLSAKIINTVVADASTYYGVANLQENVTAGELKIRVDSIFAPIVPSAASETGIVDSVVGYSKDQSTGAFNGISVTRSLVMLFAPNAQVYMGEAVIPGSWSCAGNYPLTEDGVGNVYYLSQLIGSIEYNSGTISFGADVTANDSGSHAFTYEPGAPSARVMETSGIVITEATRGRAYTFRCDPLPQKGTVRIDYMSNGKWYTLWDDGSGRCAGSDPSLGTATVNFDTGSISIGLGEAMPDVDTMLIVYWATADDYFPLGGTSTNWYWDFLLNDEGIARGSLSITWGLHEVKDSGTSGVLDYWYNGSQILTEVGTLEYSTGKVFIEGLPVTPSANQPIDIQYDQGPVTTDIFPAKTYDTTNRWELPLSNTNAIVPGTLKIEFSAYSHPGAINRYRYWFSKAQFQELIDNGSGSLDEGVHTTPSWAPATLVYTAGAGHLAMSPIRTVERRETVWDWGEGPVRPS